MIAYLKNQNPSQKRVTFYEKAHGKKLNLRHLYVIGLKTWVHVPRKQWKKLNNRAIQEIFVQYKRKNLYRIYHLLTK